MTTTMTASDIADHNAIAAELTAGDGIARLTWEQWGAAFAVRSPVLFALGAQVACVDSATMGTVIAFEAGVYHVTFPDLDGACEYRARQMRPWPLV